MVKVIVNCDRIVILSKCDPMQFNTFAIQTYYDWFIYEISLRLHQFYGLINVA